MKLQTLAALGVTALMLTACGGNSSKEPTENEIKTMTENGFKTLYPNGAIVLKELKKKECTDAGTDAVRCSLSITIEAKNPATGETKSQTQEPTIMFRKVDGKWIDTMN